MTTHVENKQPNTFIKDSTISVDTLNINNSSSEEAILSILPRYHSVDNNSHVDYVFDLDPPVNLDLKSLFKLFINGNLIPSSLSLNGEGVFLYPLGTQYKINGTAYTSLVDEGAILHILYTSI